MRCSNSSTAVRSAGHARSSSSSSCCRDERIFACSWIRSSSDAASLASAWVIIGDRLVRRATRRAKPASRASSGRLLEEIRVRFSGCVTIFQLPSIVATTRRRCGVLVRSRYMTATAPVAKSREMAAKIGLSRSSLGVARGDLLIAKLAAQP